jgi:hypothetical protein
MGMSSESAGFHHAGEDAHRQQLVHGHSLLQNKPLIIHAHG